MNAGMVYSAPVQWLLILLASALASAAAFWIAKTVRIEPGASRRLEKFSGALPAGAVEEIGQRVLRTTGVRVERWAGNLEWAQLGGHLAGWTAETMVGRAVLLGLGMGVALILLGASFLLVAAGGALGAFLIILQVNSRAAEVRTQISREVPVTAALVAAELAAGNPPDKAIERAATVSGPMGRLLQRALQESRGGGRPLFSRKPVRGTLAECLMGAGLPQLTAFAAQLDMAASKGVQGAELMATIAQSIAREHQAVMMERAESLENALLGPLVIFFFLPFVAAIMIPMIAGMFSAF